MVVNAIRRIFASWSLPLVLLGVLLWYLALATYPRPSFWYQIEDIVVFDVPEGEEIVLDVDREIRRPFTARWSVLVREYSESASGWEIVCVARGHGDYRPDATLPEPLTLRWWTNGQCPQLEPGRYMISTVWRIDAPTLGERVVARDSNIFVVGDE